jgi:hypothetical protein
MVGLPWAFTANDFTMQGLLLNGGLLVLPGFALMRLAESLDRKRAQVSDQQTSSSERRKVLGGV